MVHQATATQQRIRALKLESPATLLFFGEAGAQYTASGSDAVEVCFCTSIPLRYPPRHIPDEGTRVIIAADRMSGIIARLLDCGNPVALIDELTGEVSSYRPAPYDLFLDEADEQPQRVDTIPYAQPQQPGVEWMNFSGAFAQVGQPPALPAFTIGAEETMVPF